MGMWIAAGGMNMLLYLAALSNVPKDLLDAAEVDGAGRWSRFRHVTWPQLAPTTFFIAIMSVIGGLQGGFEQARVMTNGGPAGADDHAELLHLHEGLRRSRTGLRGGRVVGDVRGHLHRHGDQLALREGTGGRAMKPDRRGPGWAASPCCTTLGMGISMPVRLDGLRVCFKPFARKPRARRAAGRGDGEHQLSLRAGPPARPGYTGGSSTCSSAAGTTTASSWRCGVTFLQVLTSAMAAFAFARHALARARHGLPPVPLDDDDPWRRHDDPQFPDDGLAEVHQHLPRADHPGGLQRLRDVPAAAVHAHASRRRWTRPRRSTARGTGGLLGGRDAAGAAGPDRPGGF